MVLQGGVTFGPTPPHVSVKSVGAPALSYAWADIQITAPGTVAALCMPRGRVTPSQNPVLTHAPVMPRSPKKKKTYERLAS